MLNLPSFIMGTRRGYFRAALAAFGLMLWGATGAAATPLPLLAKLVFKSATYDANLPPAQLSVLILAPAPVAPSVAEISAAFAPTTRMKVHGRNIVVEVAEYAGTAALAKIVAQRKPYALFVSDLVPDRDLGAVRDIAREHRVLTFAQSSSRVHAGMAMGVDDGDETRKIVLNMPVAIEQGRQFAGSFIQLCTVIR